MKKRRGFALFAACVARASCVACASLAGALLSACSAAEAIVPTSYICQNGIPLPGTSAKPHDTRCAACDTGYRLEGAACAINAHTCANGIAAPGSPKKDQTPRCAACNSGFNLQEFACVENQYFCARGTPKAGRSAFEGETGCAACDGGFHLAEIAETATGATICELNAYACPNGTPAGGHPAKNNEIRCAQCDLGHHLNEIEACAENAYTCVDGTARSDGTPPAHNTHYCVGCDIDNGVQYRLSNDAVTGAQVCVGPKYICVNGIPKTGTPPTWGDHVCADCHTGYRLTDDNCVAHTYACAHGTPARGIPAIDQENRCVACNGGYYLDGVTCESLSGFGIGEYDPAGLAAIGDTLYMIGYTHRRLYTLDRVTGLATPVGTPISLRNALAPGSRSARRGFTAIGAILYMTHSRHTHYVIYPKTGVATTSSYPGPNQSSNTSSPLYLENEEPGALGAIGDTLYIARFFTGRLFSLSTSTRATAFLGTVPILTDKKDMAAIGNTLYVVSREGTIFGVNAATLATTPAGSIARHTADEYDHTGVAAIGNTLYIVEPTTDRLHAFDITTGAATTIGGTSK